MKKILNILLIAPLLSLLLFSCSEEEIDMSQPSPTVKFAFDTLYVDLNKIDNPPIVAFIKSTVGLESVTLKIDVVDSIITYNTITEFFDQKAFSLSQKLSYASNFKYIIVEAIDRAGKISIGKLPLKITNVVAPPKITFTVDSIVYDELIGGKIPNTAYTVESEAGLTKIEMFLATADGQVPYIDPIELSDKPTSFDFSQLVEYSPNMKGFIVKATDSYNQIGIVTLPFIYREMPTPEITLLSLDTINVPSAGNIEVKAHIKAVRGIQSIQIIRKQNNGLAVTEEVIKSELINGALEEKEINYQLPVDDATSAIIIKVTNRIGKERTIAIKTFVNMQFITSRMGGLRYDIGLMRYHPTFITPAKLSEYEDYLDVYALFSIKDAKTYSMDYYIEALVNTTNVDMKFNINWDVNNPWYQISGIGVGVDDGAFKASDGTTISSLDPSKKVTVSTKFKIMDESFNFEEATASSIREIDPTSVDATSVRFYDMGTVIAFKTDEASTAGGGRVGVMKEIERIPVFVPGYGTYQHQFSISVIQIKILN